jgi:NAD(P)-dependent dehydrogenase (short-subunit alcohol dehydrogenase family)
MRSRIPSAERGNNAAGEKVASGESEEIAEAVLFLASKSSDFMTDQTLSVSGGLTMV